MFACRCAFPRQRVCGRSRYGRLSRGNDWKAAEHRSEFAYSIVGFYTRARPKGDTGRPGPFVRIASMSSQVPAETEAPRFTMGVQALIAINVAIYYLHIVGISATPEQTFGFALKGVEARWWTVATYMVVHGGFWHLAATMYALYLFGPRLEQSWGTRRFMRFYLFCALAGLLAHAAFIRNGSALIGAAAPVFGIMIAHAMQWPTDEVFLLGTIPVRVWTAVWSLVAINLAIGMALTGSTAGMHFAYLAHLGGVGAGWAFMRTPGAPSLEQLRQRVSRVPDVEEPPRPIPRSQPRSRERDDTDEIVQRSRAMLARRTPTRMPAAKADEPRRDELNRVLDKISALGIDSLTEDERRTLEDMARQLKNG
jgi:membrane associated rhomboid family serine protease